MTMKAHIRMTWRGRSTSSSLIVVDMAQDSSNRRSFVQRFSEKRLNGCRSLSERPEEAHCLIRDQASLTVDARTWDSSCSATATLQVTLRLQSDTLALVCYLEMPPSDGVCAGDLTLSPTPTSSHPPILPGRRSAVACVALLPLDPTGSG